MTKKEILDLQNSAHEKPIWHQAMLTIDATIQDAIKSLDQSGLQIVLVVSSEKKLLGTITDGDIRRGLLKGFNLKSLIECILNKGTLVVPPHLSSEAVLQIMQANKVLQLPVIDENRKVVGLYLWDELIAPVKKANIMVIMAGGKGVRLRPHTENCPKPMLLVNGKPILEHIIERAKSEGFNHFVLAIHYLGHMVEEYFGDGSKWNVVIEYIKEDKPLGTAGAISLMDPLPSMPFLVSNGDVITDIRYDELLDFHCRHGAMATMAVRLHEWEHPFGVVITDGVEIVGFEEKPISRSHINAGIYVLEPKALEFLKNGDICDMPTLFARLQEASKRTIAYPMHEPWLDVGKPDDLEKVRKSHTLK